MHGKKLVFSSLLICILFPLFTNFALGQDTQNPSRGNRILFGDFRIEAASGVEAPALFQLFLYAGPNIVARQSVAPGGRYRFNNLNPGEYNVVMELDGSEVYRNRIRIEPMGPLDMRSDIVLVMKSPPSSTTSEKSVSASSLYKRNEENQKLFQQAMDAGKQKNYEQAKTLLQQVVEKDPQDYFAWTELGTTFFNLKKPTDAEAAYQKAIAANATFFPALLNLGKLQLSEKKFDGAIETLTKAVEADAKSADANHFLGEAYLQNKKGSKAVGYLNEALRLDPVGKAEIHLRLAALYNGAGMKDRAVAEYEQFLAKMPNYPDKAQIEKYIKENKKP